jgi:hypothetical protein
VKVKLAAVYETYNVYVHRYNTYGTGLLSGGVQPRSLTAEPGARKAMLEEVQEAIAPPLLGSRI